MRRRAISLAATSLAALSIATTACSDSGSSGPTTTEYSGVLPTPSYTFGPTTTFMADCARMPTPGELSAIVGIPLDTGAVVATGTCEFRGLNDQTRTITLSLLTDPADQASFNDLVASVGAPTPIDDPAVPGAAIGPSNTVFVTTPAGIYTVVTAITGQPLEEQYSISIAVLAMWTTRVIG